MLGLRYLLFLMTFGLLLTSVSAIGVYDNSGDFIYFISNPSPTVNITLQSTAEPIEVALVDLTIDGVEFGAEINTVLQPTQEETFSFSFPDDLGVPFELEEGSDIYFDLFVLGTDNQRVKPRGDPTQFKIDLDTQLPAISIPQQGAQLQLTESQKEITIQFSEAIASYSLILNGQLVEEYVESSRFLRDYKNRFDLDLSSASFIEGTNELEIVYTDIAGNQNSDTYSVSFRGAPLQVTLLTSADESSLTYYFNKEFPDFFNRTIYTSEKEFELKVKTSKKAHCYISTSLLSYDTFNRVNPKDLMNSPDQLTHTFDMNTVTEDKFWLACQNTAYVDDIVYLNEELGFKNNLIGLQFNTGAELEIIEAFPQGLVSTIPFNIDLRTTARAVCTYSIASISQERMTSETYITHSAIGVETSVGQHTMSFRCFDVLNNVDTLSQSVEVDPEKGVLITNYEPQFTDTASAFVRMILSEDALCKISSQQQRTSDFDTLNTLDGIGLERTFTASGLEEGENFYYVYCQKLNNINTNILSLTYDPFGPSVENLSFLNVGIESDYVGSVSEISFIFDVQSLSPLETYYAEVVSVNGTIVEEISGTQATLIGDFANAQKLRVIAQNILGKNSSAEEKIVKFDLNPPTVTINVIGETVSISCFDTESGCRETFYGFSQTALDCNPTIFYSGNESLDFGKNNYICARSTDFIGNTQEAQKGLVVGFALGNSSQIDFTVNESQIDLEDEEGDEEDIEPLVPTSLPAPEEGVNVVLIAAAAVLLLAGFGSGTYYAYRKGYLDEQLVKMGVLKAPRTKGSAGLQTQPTLSQSVAQRKSKYDDHLRKLNDFIDDTLDKRKKVFTSFSDTPRGKSKGYDDTLAKKGLGTEKEDAFYKGSKKQQAKKQSLEKASESFDEYHTKKKQSKEIKKKTKSSK